MNHNFSCLQSEEKVLLVQFKPENVVWPIAHGFPSLSLFPTAGIRGTQASTGDEDDRAGCENPPAIYAKGMEDTDCPHILPKAEKILPPL